MFHGGEIMKVKKAKCKNCGEIAKVKPELINNKGELKEVPLMCPNCTTKDGCLNPVDPPRKFELVKEE